MTNLLSGWTTYPKSLAGDRVERVFDSPRVTIRGGTLVRPSLRFEIDGDILGGEGDFAEGHPSWLNALPSQASWDPNVGQGDSRSLKLSGHPSGSTIGPTSIGFPVLPGDKLRATVWAMADAQFSSTDSKMRVYAYPGGALIASPSYISLTNPNVWYERMANFTIGADINSLAFRLQRNGIPGNVWVDNVKIEQYCTSVTPLVELRLRTFDSSGIQLSDSVIGTHSAAVNSVTTTPGSIVLGGQLVTLPTFADTVQLSIRVTNNFNFGSMTISKPKILIDERFGGNEGRFHFIVEEAVTGEILTRDLVVQKPKLMRAVSGAANIQFEVNAKDYSAEGIYFKPWGHWIHAEKTILGERKIWASCLVVPSQIDPKTGIMQLEARGFSSYMEKMPWLDNWNPLACDAFEPVHRVWNHLQSYPTGNLGVQVYPALSGIEMLPGYAFDGEIANLNFFAEFIRAEDRQDCKDHVDKLARDIPFDYVEQSGWNGDRTAIWKKLFLGYPKAGVEQTNLAFVLGENVIEAKPHIETEIDWVSDVIIAGWFPGTEHSAQLTNADPKRFRRVVMEDDARINSDERAAAWARRKLTRRQTPAYWESIVIDPGHSNAPFGSFDVGDRIWVSGKMPWVGDVRQLHKIIAIAYEEASQSCQLTLRAEGAFDYDPIYYQESPSGKAIVVPQPIPVTVGVGTPTIG